MVSRDGSSPSNVGRVRVRAGKALVSLTHERAHAAAVVLLLSATAWTAVPPTPRIEIQALNVARGWDERAGLTFPGLHP